MRLQKVISGGQVGVDRIGLDVAMSLGIPVGGFCPAGRRAEDGRVPDVYPLVETSSSSYHDRTVRNITVSDTTLVVYFKLPLSPGTALTVRKAKLFGRHLVEVYLPDPRLGGRPRIVCGKNQIVTFNDTIAAVQPRVLNIAGPREVPWPQAVADVLCNLLHAWRSLDPSSSPEYDRQYTGTWQEEP